MQEAIAYGAQVNPIWPFSAMIVDKEGRILVKATDCAHISPLFHAESLAVHTLIEEHPDRKFDDLTLVTTAEPDPLSQSAVQWAAVTHDIPIRTIVYGCPIAKIQEIWPFGIDISAKEINERSSGKPITFIGPVLEEGCYRLFLQAKERQKQVESDHPGRKVLSKNREDFVTLTLPAPG